jgi:hypothetical protein
MDHGSGFTVAQNFAKLGQASQTDLEEVIASRLGVEMT